MTRYCHNAFTWTLYLLEFDPLKRIVFEKSSNLFSAPIYRAWPGWTRRRTSSACRGSMRGGKTTIWRIRKSSWNGPNTRAGTARALTSPSQSSGRRGFDVRWTKCPTFASCPTWADWTFPTRTESTSCCRQCTRAKVGKDILLKYLKIQFKNSN